LPKKRQQEYRTIDRQINKLIREAIAAANRKAALEKRKLIQMHPFPRRFTKIELIDQRLKLLQIILKPIEADTLSC
jgi:hypothetical protein